LSEIQQRFAHLLAGAPRDGVALAFGGNEWTWGDVIDCATKVIAALDELGLDEGARVGMILRNRPQDMAALAAIIATGRCVTTLSPLQPADRLAGDVDANELPVVVTAAESITDPHLAARLAAKGRVIILGEDGSATITPGEPTEGNADRAYLSGTCIEMFTSGTTGKPKRVELTYAQMDLSLGSASISFRESADGTIELGTGVQIISTPLVHIGGLWNAIAAMYAGRMVVLMDRFQVAEWVNAVATYRPKVAGLVPAAMRMVLDANIPPERLSSLVAVMSGTAPCPPEMADEMFQRYGTRVLMTYGATEFSGAVAGWDKPTHIRWWATKKGAAGRPFPGVEMRVVDEQGNPLPTAASGVLEIKTKQAPNGGKDWIRTSDLARLDEDGFLWIEGRADDAIIRGGFKVHPPVVRKALEAHPAVAEASVAGILDERLGAVPVAAVELRPGVTAPTGKELQDFVRATLTPYEVPVRILVVDELPRTAAMKVNRSELLALFDDVPAAS
jgi:acyl-coenzyme A synthetase/AMP-(fatty) acid ligase